MQRVIDNLSLHYALIWTRRSRLPCQSQACVTYRLIYTWAHSDRRVRRVKNDHVCDNFNSASLPCKGSGRHSFKRPSPRGNLSYRKPAEISQPYTEVMRRLYYGRLRKDSSQRWSNEYGNGKNCDPARPNVRAKPPVYYTFFRSGNDRCVN